MNAFVPRMRMFAGPNGSGKSSLKSHLRPELIGVYLNADEIEAMIRRDGELDLAQFQVQATVEEITGFLEKSALLQHDEQVRQLRRLRIEGGRLVFREGVIDSYFASALVDFLRSSLLEAGRSFTFETVMSHSGKVEFLARAQEAGFRTYLYYVATDDPAINISRVQNRVALNGHDVPPELVEKRYHRSLALLLDAIRHTNRAYIFDNSTDNSDRRHTWLAEITDGQFLELKTDSIPAWFRRSVLDRIRPVS